jgi:hypothetical protein
MEVGKFDTRTAKRYTGIICVYLHPHERKERFVSSKTPWMTAADIEVPTVPAGVHDDHTNKDKSLNECANQR